MAKKMYDAWPQGSSRAKLLDKVLVQLPPRMHKWFLAKFPEPAMWLQVWGEGGRGQEGDMAAGGGGDKGQGKLIRLQARGGARRRVRERVVWLQVEGGREMGEKG